MHFLKNPGIVPDCSRDIAAPKSLGKYASKAGGYYHITLLNICFSQHVFKPAKPSAQPFNYAPRPGPLDQSVHSAVLINNQKDLGILMRDIYHLTDNSIGRNYRHPPLNPV